MKVGDKIKIARKKKGYTQTELGKIIGVGKEAIYKYEKGVVQNLPIETVKKIASALDIKPVELIYDEPIDVDFFVTESSIGTIYNELSEDAQIQLLRYAEYLKSIDNA